jgi:hypothetical protein
MVSTSATDDHAGNTTGGCYCPRLSPTYPGLTEDRARGSQEPVSLMDQ